MNQAERDGKPTSDAGLRCDFCWETFTDVEEYLRHVAAEEERQYLVSPRCERKQC